MFWRAALCCDAYFQEQGTGLLTVFGKIYHADDSREYRELHSTSKLRCNSTSLKCKSSHNEVVYCENDSIALVVIGNGAF